MTYTIQPQGVCARSMQVDVDEDHLIHNLVVVGGCSGNLQGISRLIEGMTVQEAIARLKGIRCGAKPTSCPDQLALNLERLLQQAQA